MKCVSKVRVNRHSHSIMAAHSLGTYNNYKNKTAFPSKVDHPWMWVFNCTRFWSSDLHLESMTLIYKRHLDILKIHRHTKSEVSRPMLSKIRAWTGQIDTQRYAQTHRETQTKHQPHSRVVKTGSGTFCRMSSAHWYNGMAWWYCPRSL